MRLAALVLLLLCIQPTVLQSKDRNGLNISIVAAVQPECPLIVSGIEMRSDKKGYGATVYNSSKLKITEYEIHWIAAAPPGCSSKTQARRSVVSRPVHGTIAPNSSATSPDSRIPTAQLEKIADDLATAHLQVQVGIARVRFENGSSWKVDDDDIFAPSLLKDESDKCVEAK